MTNADADKDLIARIAARDGAAMRALYARHNVRVFRYLVRQARSEAIAEELTNEVFLDVWRQAGKFEGRSAVSTWMLSIAAAHVTGLAALLMEKDPEAGGAAIMEAIASTAHDLGPRGHDVRFGAGRVDAHAALTSLSGN